MAKADRSDPSGKPRTFRNLDLSGARFEDVNLSGAELRNVALTGATIRDACLGNVQIEDAGYEGMRIEGILVTELLRVYRERPEPPPRSEPG